MNWIRMHAAPLLSMPVVTQGIENTWYMAKLLLFFFEHVNCYCTHALSQVTSYSTCGNLRSRSIQLQKVDDATELFACVGALHVLKNLVRRSLQISKIFIVPIRYSTWSERSATKNAEAHNTYTTIMAHCKIAFAFKKGIKCKTSTCDKSACARVF